jgi:hypothetical protein
MLHLRKTDNPRCKKCAREYAAAYRKTKIGVVTEIYSDQRKNSKRRGHKLPEYTKQELVDWILSQEVFDKLYNDWVNSGYNKMSKPSCDRKEDSKRYSFGNIQLMTWADNKAKGHECSRIGIFNTGNPFRAVVKKSRNGEFIAEYISTREAARANKCSQANICRACKSKTGYASGGVWSYK